MPERQLKHIQISEAVRTSILSGELSNPLPEMGELGKKFGTSRLTMRDALFLLQDQGIVRIEQGAGTFITIPREPSISDSGITSGDLRAAVIRYSDFLANPGLSNEIKSRMIQIVDAQIKLVNDLNPSEL